MLAGARVDARHAVIHDVHGDQYNIFNNQLPENLWNLNPANMDASSRAECLSDTRLDIIGFMKEFASRRNEEQNVMWLYGVAGSGKSTLATTVANYFREQGCLGAFLFFDRDIAERNDPTMVVRTLAYQLGSSDKRIGAAISASISSISSITQSPIRLQFSKLLVEPLSSVGALQEEKPLVVVLDALDECGNFKTRHNLLEVISQESVRLRKVLRIIITSRPAIDIKKYLSTVPHVLSRELDITSDDNVDDVMAYLRNRMSIIQHDNSYLSLPLDWPGEVRLSELSARASGLFIWAAVACNFIEDGHYPAERLDILLRPDVASEAESALDELYRTALECSGKWNDPVFCSQFRTILGVILVARNPLSCSAIDALSMTKGHPSLHTIAHFGCVLRWKGDGPVRILHPSFADFLSRDRCESDAWYIDTVSANTRFANDCILRLDQCLRKNICDLTLSQTEVKESLSSDISYACASWIDHVCMIPPGDDTVFQTMEYFISRHLLHWFEAMAILKMSLTATSLLGRLFSRIQISFSPESEIAQLVRDAHRFSQAFAESCEQHPLLVYASALPFTPTNTSLCRKLRRQDDVPWLAGGPQEWSPLLLVITGHSASVRAVIFSPDGGRVASCSGDMSVRIWDATTGAMVVPPLLGHDGAASLVNFSPNGTRIAAICHNTIRVWDATTGAIVGPPLLCGADPVSTLALSPDGMRIAGGLEFGYEVSLPSTIKVWDVATGAHVVTLPLPLGNNNHIVKIKFSPDGKRIASRSFGAIRIWDVTPCANIIAELTPLGGQNHFTDFAFSPDNTYIAVASDYSHVVARFTDSIIHLWDIATSAYVVPPILCAEGVVQSVEFLSDGKLFARFTNIPPRAWDTKSGLRVPTKENHSELDRSKFNINNPMFNVNEMEFTTALSHDGTRRASGSKSGVIRIWDMTQPWAPPSRSPPHIRGVSLLMSPNCMRIITSSGPSMRSWSAMSGAELSSLGTRALGVRFAAFSRTGHRMVSVSENCTVRAWDTFSGALLFESRSFLGVKTAAFTHDGCRLVCGMDDGGIRLIDSKSGELILDPREKHAGPILSVTCSPDGSTIASGSMDNSVRIWRPDSGSDPMALNGHQSWICSIAFSPDGKQIISASEDGTIRLWGVKSGLMSGTDISVPVDGVSYPNICVAFSPNGDLIICRVANHVIYVFDKESGMCCFSANLGGYPITHDSQSPVIVTADGWIIDVISQVRISKLPPTILNSSLVSAASCRTAIALVTWDKLFVMHFVPCSPAQDPKSLRMGSAPPSFVFDPDALQQPLVGGELQIEDNLPTRNCVKHVWRKMLCLE